MRCSGKLFLAYGLSVASITTVLIVIQETSYEWENTEEIKQALVHTEDSTIFEQRLRKAQTLKTCHQLRNHSNTSLDSFTEPSYPLDRAMFDNMYVDTRYKLMFCEIPKVACTNVKIMMLLLTGKMNTTDPTLLRPDKVHGEYSRKYLTKVSDFSELEIKRKLATYFKAMIVRNPFERLLSAYRNKFTVHYNDYFKQRFGRQIIKKYRQSPSKKALETGGDVTFHEFVQYLLDPATKTVGEFNPHWRTYQDLCHPCQIEYDFIGKYESLEVDVEFLLQVLGVGDHIRMPPSRISGTKTAQLLPNYFKNITASQMRDLWRLYSNDFNMFGYNYSDFI